MQSGQKFPSGGFGAHGASGPFGAHGLLRAAPLPTKCWTEAPTGGGGEGGLLASLDPWSHPPPVALLKNKRINAFICSSASGLVSVQFMAGEGTDLLRSVGEIFNFPHRSWTCSHRFAMICSSALRLSSINWEISSVYSALRKRSAGHRACQRGWETGLGLRVGTLASLVLTSSVGKYALAGYPPPLVQARQSQRNDGQTGSCAWTRQCLDKGGAGVDQQWEDPLLQ